MDITHQRLASTFWSEPHKIAMEGHHMLHKQTPFDHQQWSYLPNSSSTKLLTSPNLLSIDPSFKQEGAYVPEDEPEEELGDMKEMMFKIAAMQPVDIDPATVRKPRRRNVRISDEPQSVAARHRRERISERIRILQRLVPGGTKMDTAAMLDEAIRYVKFLKRQIRILQANGRHQYQPPCIGITNSAITPPEDWVPVTSKVAAAPTTSSTYLSERNNNAGGAGYLNDPQVQK